MTTTSIDWAAKTAELDEHGCALLPGLLDESSCAAIRELWEDRDRFRSEVNMARHGYGRGVYRYFDYPLPDPIAALRTELYVPLAGIANRWAELFGSETRYPAEHAAYLERCHQAGQVRPTPLLLRYGAGDWNALHQDLYGEHVFPLQVAILLSRPQADFTGGEFVLTEQRPRMQSRPEVVPLRAGRRGDLSGARASGEGQPRLASRQHAPRRQPAALGGAHHARHHLSRRIV